MKRKIAVIIGSDSDLTQCVDGFDFLRDAKFVEYETYTVETGSIHRNTMDVLSLIKKLAKENIDVIVAGAGWANHLTGTTDAYLRYTLKDDKVVVVGVAFEDENNILNTMAAVLSITQVPGAQVVFNNYIGPRGFTRACQFAVAGELPKITLKEPKPTVSRSLSEAIDAAKKKTKEKEREVR